MANDTRNLIKQLQRQGFDVEKTRRGHFAVRRNGGPVVFMPSTPSDVRSLERVKSKLKRIGYEKNG